MSFVLYSAVFVFGAIIGSFLNVIIVRFHTGAGVAGRSRCLSCTVPLSWHDLIPVVSFCLLLGRCRSCRGHISWQYPLIELCTTALFLGTFLSVLKGGAVIEHALSSLTFSLPPLLWFDLFFFWVVWSVLLVIIVYDVRHKIIPNVFVYALAMLAIVRLVFLFFLYKASGPPLSSFFLGGPLLALPFFLIWYFSRGRAMGFGDVKLAIPIGWIFGISQSAVIFIFSFWIGAIVGIGLLVSARMQSIFQKRKTMLSRIPPRVTMKSEVPFAPFLIAAMALVFFFDFDFSAFLHLISTFFSL